MQSGESSPKKKLSAGWLMAAMTLSILGIVAAVGFTFYRSNFGPNPCFRIDHVEGTEIQSVTINGQRAAGVQMTDHRFVHHHVRPMDSVNLQIVTTDGREFIADFSEMGRITRTVQIDDSNL